MPVMISFSELTYSTQWLSKFLEKHSLIVLRTTENYERKVFAFSLCLCLLANLRNIDFPAGRLGTLKTENAIYKNKLAINS